MICSEILRNLAAVLDSCRENGSRKCNILTCSFAVVLSVCIFLLFGKFAD